MADIGLFALKLALKARQAEAAAAVPPPMDFSPIVDELQQMKAALGVMARAPRRVAAP